MNTKRVAATALIFVGLAGLHHRASANAPESEPILIGSHRHYNGRFASCQALQRSNIDSATANSLLAFGSSAQSAIRTINNGLDMLVPGYQEETDALEQSTRYVPMSSFVCSSAAVGRQVTFDRTFFTGRVKGITVRNDRGSVEASFVADGKGLDGEDRFALSSMTGVGDLDRMSSGVAVTCLMNSSAQTRIAGAFTDAMGGFIGALMGSGSEENATMRAVCERVEAELG